MIKDRRKDTGVAKLWDNFQSKSYPKVAMMPCNLRGSKVYLYALYSDGFCSVFNENKTQIQTVRVCQLEPWDG